jgi:hypothetical protein
LNWDRSYEHVERMLRQAGALTEAPPTTVSEAFRQVGREGGREGGRKGGS